MIGKIFSAVVGTHNDRELKRLKPKMELIASLEPRISKLSDAELRAKTGEFKAKIKEGLKDRDLAKLEKDERRRMETEILEGILPEAFAVVREASKRVTGMRHFDVQLIGGIVLHEGKIAEMATGEGKTLVATLPAYLNALTGLGVHIVTVNDYLAKRDRDWMTPLYEFLGLKAGAIQSNQEYNEKKAAYLCDITYGTNNEFGFDYLRDNMRVMQKNKVQISRGLNYA